LTGIAAGAAGSTLLPHAGCFAQNTYGTWLDSLQLDSLHKGTSTAVAIENSLTGTTGWMLTNPALGSYTVAREIEGYASATSVNAGDTIELFVRTAPLEGYVIEIYRLGWYQGVGGRQMQWVDGSTISQKTITVAAQPASQPLPTQTSPSSMAVCAWTQPYTLLVPATWLSGAYVAKLTTTGSGKQSYILFVVRNDERFAHYMFQSAVTTFQAYNEWPYRNGGGPDVTSGFSKSPSLYNSIGIAGCSSAPTMCSAATTDVCASDLSSHDVYPYNWCGGPMTVSFDRPYGLYDAADSLTMASRMSHTDIPSAGYGVGDFLYWELNMLRWLESVGYDVKYCTSLDAHADAGCGQQFGLDKTRTILSVGHDEYWSSEIRNAFVNARTRGTNLAFFGSNVGYWKITVDSTGRQITVDKHGDADLWSTHDAPEEALVGVHFFQTTRDRSQDMVIPAPSGEAPARRWPFVGTTLLASGGTLSGLIGYELDQTTTNSPANIFRLAETPLDGYCPDQGWYDFVGNTEATIYTVDAGGSQVFAAGTNQWSWGLDNFNTGGTNNGPAARPAVASSTVQQITTNILNRFAYSASQITAGGATYNGWYLDYDALATPESLGSGYVVRSVFLTEQNGPLWRITPLDNGKFNLQLASGPFQDWYLDFDGSNGQILLSNQLYSGGSWAITVMGGSNAIASTAGSYVGWKLDVNGAVGTEQLGDYTIARALRLATTSSESWNTPSL